MQYHPLPVSHTYRRFVALAKKVQRLLERGEFHQLSAQQQQRLAEKLKRLYLRLSGPFSPGRLRRILASAALILGLGGGAVQAQQFASFERNPFGLESEKISLITFADLDNDGDQDLLSIQYNDNGGQNFVYWENEGTAQAPAFAAAQTNPFGLSSFEYLTTPHLVDIDNDGDLDLFAGTYESIDEYTGNILFFENVGTPGSPAFAPQQMNPFGLEPSDYQMVPVLVDLDNDGDFDLLGTNYNFDTELIEFRYQENLGAAEAPQFGPPVNTPFGLSNESLYVLVHTVGDLDMDGDYDVLAGGVVYDDGQSRPTLEYMENTGSAGAPAFAAPVTNPFGIEFPLTAYATVPALVDIDGDGDLDLFVAGYEYDLSGSDGMPVIWYFENTGMVNSTREAEPVAQLKVFPTVTQHLLNWQLDLEEKAGSLQLQAFASDGRPVRQWRVEALPGQQQGQVDVGALPAGLYQLRLSDGSGRLLAQERFVVR